jgi:hypothetical protein
MCIVLCSVEPVKDPGLAFLVDPHAMMIIELGARMNRALNSLSQHPRVSPSTNPSFSSVSSPQTRWFKSLPMIWL